MVLSLAVSISMISPSHAQPPSCDDPLVITRLIRKGNDQYLPMVLQLDELFQKLNRNGPPSEMREKFKKAQMRYVLKVFTTRETSYDSKLGVRFCHVDMKTKLTTNVAEFDEHIYSLADYGTPTDLTGDDINPVDFRDAWSKQNTGDFYRNLPFFISDLGTDENGEVEFDLRWE